MWTISADELDDLADSFGVFIGEDEREGILEQVNANLEGLTEVGDFLEESSGRGEDRSWHRPTEDPYNAIAVECEVPPVRDHTGALGGVTAGLKDNIAVAGVPMECGSDFMDGFVPDVDATVVERLRGAGVQITAKTNMDSFAVGSRAISDRGRLLHPSDAKHTPGGSSGGSAIAVATDQVDVALGTDTGGSIRLPAAYCGIVGLKPTYGLVPLTGIVENAYTLDHVGPMTSSVDDAATVLDALAGADAGDPASLQAAGRAKYSVGGYADALESLPPWGVITVGVLEEGLGQGSAEESVREEIVDRTERTVDTLADRGASIRRLSVPSSEKANPIKQVLSYAELASHWRDRAAPYRRGGRVTEAYELAYAERDDEASRELTAYHRARILAGAFLIRTDRGRAYTKAMAARERLSDQFREVLSGVEALVMPTTPDTAPRVEDAGSPGYSYGRNTVPGNVTGFPAITIPNGAVDGLPVGLQLVGKPFDERTLLPVAAAIEAT